MKRLSAGRIAWLDYRDKRSQASRVRQAGLSRAQGLRGFVPLTRTVVIQLPNHLAAETESARNRVLDVVHSIGVTLRDPYARIKLDFSKVVRMYPGGTLVLLALIQLYLESSQARRIKASCPPGSLAAQLLNHFGFGESLGVAAAANAPRNSSVVNWEYLTDSVVAGERVRILIEKYRNLINAELPDDLFAVLSEGITNVRHWAYPPETTVPQALRRWWMFSRYVEPENGRDGNLFIAIYDVGVGIPYNMAKKKTYSETVLATIDKYSGRRDLDKALLAQAVEHQRSSTGEDNRGRGLPEMRKFIQNTQAGRLYIVSGFAQYSCAPLQRVSGAQSCKRHFPGTLILWSLPLKAKGETK